MPQYFIPSHSLTVINNDNRMPALLLPYDILSSPSGGMQARSNLGTALYDLISSRTVYFSNLRYGIFYYDAHSAKFILESGYGTYLPRYRWDEHPVAAKMIPTLMTSSTPFVILYSYLIIYARSMIWMFDSLCNKFNSYTLHLEAIDYDPEHELIVQMSNDIYVMQRLPNQKCNKILLHRFNPDGIDDRILMKLPDDCHIEQSAPTYMSIDLLVQYDNGKLAWVRINQHSNYHPMMFVPTNCTYILTSTLLQQKSGRYIEYEGLGFNQLLVTVNTTYE